jgi:hypothetical protein
MVILRECVGVYDPHSHRTRIRGSLKPEKCLFFPSVLCARMESVVLYQPHTRTHIYIHSNHHQHTWIGYLIEQMVQRDSHMQRRDWATCALPRAASKGPLHTERRPYSWKKLKKTLELRPNSEIILLQSPSIFIYAFHKSLPFVNNFFFSSSNLQGQQSFLGGWQSQH